MYLRSAFFLDSGRQRLLSMIGIACLFTGRRYNKNNIGFIAELSRRNAKIEEIFCPSALKIGENYGIRRRRGIFYIYSN